MDKKTKPPTGGRLTAKTKAKTYHLNVSIIHDSHRKHKLTVSVNELLAAFDSGFSYEHLESLTDSAIATIKQVDERGPGGVTPDGVQRLADSILPKIGDIETCQSGRRVLLFQVWVLLVALENNLNRGGGNV